MLAPRFASITLSLDTARWKAMRESGERENAIYLVNRLLSGEPVADSALAHHGVNVAIRPTVSPEIARELPCGD